MKRSTEVGHRTKELENNEKFQRVSKIVRVEMKCKEIREPNLLSRPIPVPDS
jgi:hypothetical protein